MNRNDLVEIYLSEIELSDSRRTTPVTVNALAESMRESGLIQPVIVRRIGDDRFRVVAGNHRVSAARALSWSTIQAFITDADDLRIELLAIDENLQRAELSAAERAAWIKRRKEIWQAIHPENQVGQVGPPEIGYRKPPPQERAFAADTATATGEAKRSINRAVARADALGDDLAKVVGTSLDKGVELDALAKLPQPERRELVERAKAGERVSARPAPAPADDEGPTLEELVDDLQAENAKLTAEIQAAEADDQKAENITLVRRLQHAERRLGEAMDAAAREQRQAKRLSRQVRECCEIIGLNDPRELVPTVRRLFGQQAAA